MPVTVICRESKPDVIHQLRTADSNKLNIVAIGQFPESVAYAPQIGITKAKINIQTARI